MDGNGDSQMSRAKLWAGLVAVFCFGMLGRACLRRKDVSSPSAEAPPPGAPPSKKKRPGYQPPTRIRNIQVIGIFPSPGGGGSPPKKGGGPQKF